MLRCFDAAGVVPAHEGWSQVFYGPQGHHRFVVNQAQSPVFIDREQIGMNHVIFGTRNSEPMEMGIDPVRSGEHRAFYLQLVVVRTAFAQ